jgi:TRAP transporter TAXI family solute receptor
MAMTTYQPLRPAFAALLVVCCLPLARSAAAAPPDTLRIATGSVGGTFLPVGRDLASWFEATIPGLTVIADTTAGSVDNLDRLSSGRAELGIVGSSPFREVLAGWGALSDEAKTICTLGTLYADAEQYVVRASLMRANNLLDLSGLLMYPGPHGSGAEVDTRHILSVLEIEPRFVYVDERDKGYAAAAEALSRGDFDAATFSGGVPIRAVTDLFNKHPGEYRILPFSRHMLNKLQHDDANFERVVIRKGSYPGMEEDVQTVGGPNLLVAAPGLDPVLLARLDRAVRDGIRVPGKGLRIAQNHLVLQALDIELWNERPAGLGCTQNGVAELDRKNPNAPSPQ